MLYAAANSSWSPGDSLTPTSTRGGLGRFRSGAASADGPTLAVALRYDRTRGVVVSEGLAARGPSGTWSAPAVVDATGSVTVLAAIPAGLVRPVGPPELRIHHEGPHLFRPPHGSTNPPGVASPPLARRREDRRSWRNRPRVAISRLVRKPRPIRLAARSLVARHL